MPPGSINPATQQPWTNQDIAKYNLDTQNIQDQQAKDKKWNDWLKGLSPGSMPDFLSATNPDGTLKSDYNLTAQPSIMDQLNEQLAGINYDPTALNKLQDYATSTGPSAWAQSQQASNKVLTGNQLDAAGQQANSAKASAYSSLATRGGLRQGAAQNIAQQGQKNLLTAKQGVLNQSNINSLGITSQDAAQKLQTLQALPGAQATAMQSQLGKTSLWANSAAGQQKYATDVDQQNINTRLQNLSGQNQWNQTNYDQNMKALAADQQAAATKASKGSWICTEVHKLEALAPEDVLQLKRFKRFCWGEDPVRTHQYLMGMNGLVDKMKAQGFEFGTLRSFVLEIIALSRVDMLSAGNMYWNKCRDLQRTVGRYRIAHTFLRQLHGNQPVVRQYA